MHNAGSTSTTEWNQSAVEFFDDVFEPRYCRWLLEDARKSLASSQAFSRSSHSWDPRVVKASQPVLVRNFDPVSSSLILGALHERGVVENLEYAVMCFAWSRLSYIPWHDDGQYTSAVTVYLNEEWDPDWGGIFLYKVDNEQEIRGRVPKFNSALRNRKNIQHAISIISVDAPEPRFTLQLFYPKQSSDNADRSAPR